MNDTDRQKILTAPQLRLIGSVDEAMYAEFRNQLSAAPQDGPLVIAMTTLGGNPEVARERPHVLRGPQPRAAESLHKVGPAEQHHARPPRAPHTQAVRATWCSRSVVRTRCSPAALLRP